MARYIDADALIERLKFKRDETDKVKKKYSGLECAISQVQKQPTADVVEVVRCGKCIYANSDGTICHYDVGRDVKPDHYCGYGERKCDNE